MKIDNSGTPQVGNLQRVRSTALAAGSSRAPTGTAKGSDQVELSALSNSFEAAHTRHVAQVSAAVSEGSYHPDAQAISARMIEEHMDRSLAA
ncbi:MAG TPA: flagellar biosynthesis anti-sigma factor FlgM [Bryobacteraceae bacterium]|nr:flagellar biosynthesis anti-sigma factor FlgM [Bryobacteraceae bacterium]